MRRLLAALLILAAVSFVPRAYADSAPAAFTDAQRQAIIQILRDALKTDPSILRDAVTALQTDDAAKKEEATQAALAHLGPALTNAPGDPVAGNPHGDVTVVEFYDLRCPYCRRMVPVMAELLRQDANVRVVYKDIPILGAASVLGARAVLAAQRQDGYARLHDAVMAGPQTITEDSLRDAAGRLGLDWAKLQRDMGDPSIQARLDANLTMARTLGVDGTPVYVVGKRLLPGAVELADLQGAIAAARGR